MEIAILGFGSVAREVIRQLKELPVYGEDVRIYCVHVRRNSLSYGPDSVIEIVDKYGDGLRVYKDGYEGTPLRTMVSSFEDWLVEETQTFDKVIDCTSYNEDSVRLLYRLLNNAKRETTFFLPSKELVQRHWKDLVRVAKDKDVSLSFNSIPSGDASQYSGIDLNRDTISSYIELEDQDLFIYRNGGPVETAKSIISEIKLLVEESKGGPIDWTPVVRDSSWHESAKKDALVTADLMNQRLLDRRIEHQNKDYRYEAPGIARDTLDKADIETLTRFVINGEGDFKSESYYDKNQRRLVVKHEMLDWFFAWHKMIEAATHVLADPYLVPTGVRYVKYDDPESHVVPYITETPCIATVIYAVDQRKIWPIEIDGRRTFVGVNEALMFYSADVTQGRLRMGDTKNVSTEYLEFHFTRSTDGNPAGICTCFDKKDN